MDNPTLEIDEKRTSVLTKFRSLDGQVFDLTVSTDTETAMKELEASLKSLKRQIDKAKDEYDTDALNQVDLGTLSPSGSFDTGPAKTSTPQAAQTEADTNWTQDVDARAEYQKFAEKNAAQSDTEPAEPEVADEVEEEVEEEYEEPPAPEKKMNLDNSKGYELLVEEGYEHFLASNGITFTETGVDLNGEEIKLGKIKTVEVTKNQSTREIDIKIKLRGKKEVTWHGQDLDEIKVSMAIRGLPKERINKPEWLRSYAEKDFDKYAQFVMREYLDAGNFKVSDFNENTILQIPSTANAKEVNFVRLGDKLYYIMPGNVLTQYNPENFRSTPGGRFLYKEVSGQAKLIPVREASIYLPEKYADKAADFAGLWMELDKGMPGAQTAIFGPNGMTLPFERKANGFTFTYKKYRLHYNAENTELEINE